MNWVSIILMALTSLFSHDDKIKGLSFVGTPQPYAEDPMSDVIEARASHLAIMPYGYTIGGDNRIFFNNERQWWGEKPEGITHSIRLAHEKNLSVMVKPHIYVPGSWIGELTFANAGDWREWEAAYYDYIMYMAKIAAEEKVEIFCVGTEVKQSVARHPEYWNKLICDVREVYHGKLTYSANWDNYRDIPFWHLLDFIGISCYFPLSEEKTPSVESLVKAWQPIKKELKAMSDLWQTPILFTEFGYLSVDYCASKNWELEDRISQLPINETAQANAINAILQSFWGEEYWAGGFLWKWFPNGHGHEGYIEKDYTPQKKKAIHTLRNWYSQ